MRIKEKQIGPSDKCVESCGNLIVSGSSIERNERDTNMATMFLDRKLLLTYLVVITGVVWMTLVLVIEPVQALKLTVTTIFAVACTTAVFQEGAARMEPKKICEVCGRYSNARTHSVVDARQDQFIITDDVVQIGSTVQYARKLLMMNL